MAWYGDRKNVKESIHKEKFEKEWKPGETPAYAGIYKCQSCGYEDVINRECTKLPPCANCNKKPHIWKLLVKAEDN
jgi:hypothetical protein